MKVVYFDRNVFDHICTLNCGVTEAGIAKIQGAIDAGMISIPASYIVIEETVPILRVSEDTYEQHIQTVLNLINKDRIIKPHTQIIREDCESYALGKPLTARTTKTPDNFRDVLDLSINRDDLNSLTEEIHVFYAGLASKYQAFFNDVIDEMKHRGIRGFKSFQDAWVALSPIVVENVVGRLPRTPKRLCKKRGLKHMLKIKSIRIGMICFCWFLYSHSLKTDGSPKKVDASEAGDFFHAVCASATNIFVTQESKDKYGKLPFILNQVPVSGFTVMSLMEFLDIL